MDAADEAPLQQRPHCRTPAIEEFQLTTTAILGAGALGLTTAMRLSERGDQVTVLEREPLPGGLAAGFELAPGIWLEKFYHHLFGTDTRAIAMIEELGLSDRLEFRKPVTATLVDGRKHQLDSPASLLANAGAPTGSSWYSAR